RNNTNDNNQVERPPSCVNKEYSTNGFKQPTPREGDDEKDVTSPSTIVKSDEMTNDSANSSGRRGSCCWLVFRSG
ncbi:MAG: hypothetical protein AAF483_17210, partial [Planctomycetota bacterium]